MTSPNSIALPLINLQRLSAPSRTLMRETGQCLLGQSVQVLAKLTADSGGAPVWPPIVEGTNVEEEFSGGLLFPWGQNMGRPYVLMRVREDSIGFHLQFGLRRLFGGPWLVEREKIATIYPERRILNVFSSVKITEKGGLVWKFWTAHPDEVAQSLEEFGYPVVAGPH